MIYKVIAIDDYDADNPCDNICKGQIYDCDYYEIGYIGYPSIRIKGYFYPSEIFIDVNEYREKQINKILNGV